MSWQSYVDDQLLNTKMVTHAVICGHDGNIWAKSADFVVSFISFLYILILFVSFFWEKTGRPASASPRSVWNFFSVVVDGFVFKSRSQRPRATPTLAVGGWVTLQPFYFDIFLYVCLIVKFSEIPPRGFQKWIKKTEMMASAPEFHPPLLQTTHLLVCFLLTFFVCCTQL